MNYEELNKINAKLSKQPIKGKDYVMVNDRVQGFRELYPEGCIVTELVNYIPDDYAVVIAKVYKTDSPDIPTLPLATGMAQETIAKNKNINKTSMLENCETSAVGRALGFLGIGSVDSIASVDEINKAKNREIELSGLADDIHSAENTLISDAHMNNIMKQAKAIGIDLAVILREYAVEKLKDLTEAQYGDCMNKLVAEANKKK